MAFDPTLSTPKDQVRFIVGDTSSPEDVADDTIEALLALNGDEVEITAARVARAIATRFSKLASRTVGDLSIRYTERAAEYAKRADEIEQSISGGLVAVAPFAGGISFSDKQTREADQDRAGGSFRRGMTDNPDSPQADTTLPGRWPWLGGGG